MSRWLPHPFVSLALCVLWLLLNQTLYPGHVLLGVLLGVAAPVLTRHLNPLGYPRLHSPLVIVRLAVMTASDVVRSCFNISRVIIFADYANLKSEFIRVPLTIRDPHGLAVLSCLLNINPGTVWTELEPQRHELILHVFDLNDAEWWIENIQTRYETPLIHIFEKRGAHGDPA